MEAAAIPFPSDETTPPVTKMYLAIAIYPFDTRVSASRPTPGRSLE